MSENSTVQRRTETVYLYQGDDQVALDEALDEYQQAIVNAGPARLGDTLTTDAAAKYDKLKDELKERAVPVTVRALGGRAFRKLLAECPPRKGNEADEAAGCDTDKMSEALLEYVTDHERTIVAPALGAKSAVVAWLDDLSDGDYSLIFSAAMRVNRGGQPNPKASLTSRLEAISNATSQ
jgi:hypothetical protein